MASSSPVLHSPNFSRSERCKGEWLSSQDASNPWWRTLPLLRATHATACPSPRSSRQARPRLPSLSLPRHLLYFLPRTLRSSPPPPPSFFSPRPRRVRPPPRHHLPPRDRPRRVDGRGAAAGGRRHGPLLLPRGVRATRLGPIGGGSGGVVIVVVGAVGAKTGGRPALRHVGAAATCGSTAARADNTDSSRRVRVHLGG